MKVIVVDDHYLFRVGVRYVLSTAGDLTLAGEASNASDALPIIEREQPDVVLMDMSLPDMDGVAATREIRTAFPRTAVLIVSVHDQICDVLDALKAGASGYALKSETNEVLLTAIRTVGRGQRYLAPHLVPTVARYETKRRSLDVLEILSERERTVFGLAADSLAAREIATKLDISRKTVDTHLHRIHHKLGLRNSVELARLAAGLRVVGPIASAAPAGYDGLGSQTDPSV
ncbi:MAG TPA: response regulator transcription factor [Polyangia bacterium]|nr:response regulator transcription factor [Polyangia bacterium]